MPTPNELSGRRTEAFCALSADVLHTRIQNNGRLALDTRQYSADVLQSVFSQMAVASLQGAYLDKSSRPVWYMPVTLDEHATVQAATGAGINALSQQLAELAINHEPWAQQAQKSHRATERSHMAAETSVDSLAALQEYYEQHSRLSAGKHAMLVLRNLLHLVGNPADLAHAQTPCIVPILYSTYEFPQNYAQELDGIDPSPYRQVERIASAVVNIGFYMESTYGNQQPTRFILAGDLSPIDYLQQRPAEKTEEWIGHTKNEEILYQFGNMM